MNQLLPLVAVFSYLSLLTVGGGMAAFPELKYLTVDVHHWVSFSQLIHLYSIGQMAPGPNMMMIAAVGQWVAGPVGAIVVTAAFFLPTGLLTLLVGRLWVRLADWPWKASIQRGLGPVSIGLLLAGVMSIARGAITGWESIGIAGVVFLAILLARVNPLPLIALAAVVGAYAFH